MHAEEKPINWEKTLNLYNSIKEMYALCEETDPELCTNLQPLNEFRAALDHIMRIIAIQNFEEYKDKSAIDESRKLHSHLRRAFFDICDMLSINYRNKIIDVLEPYETECIEKAIPDYYSSIRPRLEEISETIASLRTGKRFDSSSEDFAVDEYCKIVTELQKYYKKIISATVSLNEIRSKTKVNDLFIKWIIPVGGIVIGTVIGIIGWFM